MLVRSVGAYCAILSFLFAAYACSDFTPIGGPPGPADGGGSDDGAIAAADANITPDGGPIPVDASCDGEIAYEVDFSDPFPSVGMELDVEDGGSLMVEDGGLVAQTSEGADAVFSRTFPISPSSASLAYTFVVDAPDVYTEMGCTLSFEASTGGLTALPLTVHPDHMSFDDVVRAPDGSSVPNDPLFLLAFGGKKVPHRLELDIPVVDQTKPLVVKVRFDGMPLADFTSTLLIRPDSMTLTCGIEYQQSKTSGVKRIVVDDIRLRACPRAQ